MAVFKAAKASLEDCYDQIRSVGKATPSVIKRIQALEDFTEHKRDYVELVCRTPGVRFPLLEMPKEQDDIDVLVIQTHIPFPEKRTTGAHLQYRYIDAQLSNMMPSDIKAEYTSLVKFAPVVFKHPKSRKLINKFTLAQVRHWLPYLLEEISRVKPKVIVSLNPEVTKVLGLKCTRGEVEISPICGLPVVTTMHPKYLNMIRQNASGGMWGDDYYAVIMRDLNKASDLIHGRVELRDLHEAVQDVRDNQVTVCESLEDVRYWTDFLLSLPPRRITSWDLETTSLDAWSEDARILTSQVGYRRDDGKVHAIVIPLWHRGNDMYDPDAAFEIHKEYLLHPSTKVGHNITFDIVFLAVTTGVRLAGEIIDTLLALHSMDSGIKGCYGLKVAVWDYLLESGLGGYEDLLEVEED